MATAKKTTAVKSAKTKKNNRAKISAKKTGAKVSGAQKAAMPSSVPRHVITLDKLRRFNLFSAAVSAVLAILSGWFMSSKSVDLLWPYAAKDELASANSTVYGPAMQVFVTVELRYLIAAIFAISAVFSLLLATKLRSRYEAGVKAKVSSLRWLFIGAISALYLELASITAAVVDITTFKLVAGLVLITAILGMFAEKANQSNEKNFTLFYLSLFTGFLAWLPLVFSFIGTSLYGTTILDAYTYVLAAVLLIGFSSYAMTKYRYIKNGADAKGYLQIEGNYITNSFLLNIAVFVVLFTFLSS